MTAGSRLGGHIVQGHVDGTGTIVRREPGEHWEVVEISLPAGARPLRRRQGLDHRRRRLADRRRSVDDDGFTVSLIPTTLALTTLGRKQPGDPVNLEVDVIAKYVERLLDRTRTREKDHRMNVLEPALRRPPDHRRPRRSPGARSSATRFGFASAVGGMRRRVWAWPVGIVGNVLLFTVFIAATFEADAQQPLFGQAGRQVFFIITSVYGWWRWQRGPQGPRRRGDRPAITPRWATGRERTAYLLAAAGRRRAVLQWVFCVIGAGWPAPRWYYWCDAWIFVGSMRRDLRDGPRLDRLLAGLDRRRPGRRAAAVALPATTRRRSCTSSTAAWWSGASSSGSGPRRVERRARAQRLA